MFTGIVEEVGSLESIVSRPTGARVKIQCKKVLEDASLGCSIAVNGVCLTVSSLQENAFSADVTPETLGHTNIGDLKAKSLVNLERPLSPSGRLSGHIVQGHVDGTGELISLELLGDENWWLKVKVPSELDHYLVSKGSVAIDGMSLTVASMENGVLSVAVVPHTVKNTALRTHRRGDRLNLECDVLAKYVEKMMPGREVPPESPKLTVERLREMGY